MAKITRKVAKIFGSIAGTNQISKFGSLAAGTPVFTTDPDVIQALSNYVEGWYAAVIGANSPAIQDMNALCFLFAYQIAYLMQEGIAEWNTDTIYFIGSLANDGNGNVYTSLTNSNTGNALTDTTNWAPPGGSIKTKTANYTVLASDSLIRGDASGGAFTLTLPLGSTLPVGKTWYFSKIDSSSNGVTLLCSGGDTLIGNPSQIMIAPFTQLIVKWSGTEFLIF